MKNKTVIFVVGPTAVGKTALAVEIARSFKCEILSADSRQFYREMSIGTAKPTKEEMKGIPHHFIDNLSIKQEYSAGQFENEAIDRLNELFKTNDIAVVVGGSGLFINALAFGLDQIPATPDEVRSTLNKACNEKGISAMIKQLQEIDPKYAASIDLKNKHRVLRGLEVYRSSGKRLSDLQKGAHKSRDFEMTWIGLDLPRAALYDRINSRVDTMIKNGLQTEVDSLINEAHLPPLRTVGYQEFFDPENTSDHAIDLIKRNSRRYAKRQLTWFRKNKEINWFLPHQVNEILSHIENQVV